jgi:hypothetical protein
MPGKYCLLSKLSDKFKQMLVSGKINPETLNGMTSEGRRAFFEQHFGLDNAKNINSLFEQKLLLKNQQAAMISWAKTVSGIKPDVRRDLISRIERMDARVLSPDGEKNFLTDLARTKLGTDVTFEQATKISNLSKVVSETKDAFAKDPMNEQLQLEHGMSLLKMDEYLNKIAPSKDNIALSIINLPRALMSTLDLSAPFRQGFGMVTRKEFWKNLGPMVSFWNKANYEKMQAMILADPYNEVATRAGLKIFGISKDLRLQEEAFMSSLVSKIPGLAMSERAYTGFLTKTRMDVFKSLIKKAEMMGEDVKPGSQAAKDIAHMINNFTGAGSVGKLEPAVPVLNSVFFSPRKIMANMQILNPATYLNPKTSPTARKAALRNLIGMVSTAGTLIGLASLMGNKQETSPISSDFGKVKIGNTRFDVTGGNASMAVLLARLMTGQTKSTTSGIVKDLGKDFGAKSRGDTMIAFMRNKLSPSASFVMDWMFGENAVGEPFKMTDAMKSRMMPMIMSDLMEVSEADPSMVFPTAIADIFGFGTQTYTSDVNWENSTGVELKAFKAKVGDVKFAEANNEYNELVIKKVEELSTDDKYNKKTEEEKQKFLTSEKAKIKKQVMRDYQFKYKRKKPNK